MPRFATAHIQRPRRAAVYRTITVKAPTGGLNARDSIADMPIGDAVRMTNMWPTTLDVILRNGYVNWATGLGAQTESLFPHNKPDGTKQLFGAAGANVYNVTASGAVGAAVVSGLTSARWQHTQFATSGGTFLYIVNGADDPRLYDGTTWTAINGASTPAITGVTTANLINVNVFKERLWFVEKNSLKTWYLAAGTIAGAATLFDLRPIFKKGGFLRAMGTWSIDGGQGLDDYAVFITSEGEVAVYKGTDPASASTFALVGVFQIATPLGYRCFEKFGGDLIVISRDGLLPLSLALQSNRLSTKVALTDKINSAITSLTNLYGSQFGWETQLFPQQNMLILNVPVTGGQYQFAMNTITRAWGGPFTGWNANCFERSGEDVYFGGNGVVCKIWGVPGDNGNNINGDVLQAFSQFGNGQSKYFKMAKPIVYTLGNSGILLGMNVDYDLSSPTGTPTFTSAASALWDTALWDVGVWSGDAGVTQDWQTVGSIGTAGALAMKVTSNMDTFRWEATRFVMEDARGTVL